MEKSKLAILIGVIALVIGIGIGINKMLLPSMPSEKNDEKNTTDFIDEESHEEDKNINVVDDEISVGSLAPDFTLEDLNGKKISLSDYRGKIILINFWATWCTFCDQEMPDLNDLEKENDDIVVLAVDVMEEKKKVKKYIEDGGYELTVLLDGSGQIARKYLVGSYPTTYVVDKEGILLGGVPGMMTKVQMEQIVEDVRSRD